MTGIGSSPALALCQVVFEVRTGPVSGGFPGVLPFRPNFRLARIVMSEIIVKVKLN